MEDLARLNDAFQQFTAVSRNLEDSYKKLQDKIHYLTMELQEKNLQLENALYDAEEAKGYLNGLLQSLRESIIVIDQDNNVAMLNKAAERMLNIGLREAVGKSFESLPFKVEKTGTDTFLTANSKRYNIFLSRSEISDPNGVVTGHVILMQDITRIKELESQQERNKRLIAMGEMAAKIVHEIRSPLCSIELYATMLEKELVDSQSSNLAGGISTGIRSLNNILTNMLFFAKPQKPNFRSMDINKTIEETLFMLNPLIESRNITLKEVKECGELISGDSELLKQVLMNIILNSIQVTPDEGMLEIATSNDDGFAAVEIRDEGEGIDDFHLEKIFDPFFTTKDTGTGLGLAIASKIIQGHNGLINVKSEKGKGTTFQLYFPLSKNEKEQENAQNEMCVV